MRNPSSRLWSLIREQLRQPLSSRLLVVVIALWGVFVRWLPQSGHTAEQAAMLDWLLSDRPMLHLKLQQPDKSPSLVKYSVQLLIGDQDPVRAEFDVSDDLVNTLSFATPRALVQSALQMDIQIAGVDSHGCIVAGGSQQWARSLEQVEHAVDVSSLNTILIEMKPLPHALCLL